MHFLPDTHNLSTRLLLSFVAVIVLAMLAVGLPALRLLENELERQATARVAQAASATEALYAARLREVEALARLAAERPTLYQLLSEGKVADLPPYLEAIRSTARLDGLAVLDGQGRLVAQVPATGAGVDFLTASQGLTPVQPITLAGRRALAVVARAPVQADDGSVVGAVVGLVYVDQAFLSDLKRETGVHHALFLDGEQVATTLPALPARLGALPSEPLQVGDEPFYLQHLALEEGSPSVVDVLALPARELVETRARVVQLLGSSTLLVTVTAALLASLVAHHVTAPVQALVTASEGMGRGDLATPIQPRAGVTEVVTLAYTLEQMRGRLQAAYEALRRSKAWSENLIASLAEGVVTVDAAGHLTSFSPGAERILGWQAQDVIGRSFWGLIGEAAPGGAEPSFPLPIVTGGGATRQTGFTRAGEPLTLLITSGSAPSASDGAWEQAYVFRDVTEEERSLRLREFLLANVSHEFKTPLAALRAAVEFLVADLPTLSEAELQELVNSVWQGTVRLEELVDNLLSSASLHTGHFTVRPHPTELEAVIEEVLLGMRPLLASRGQWLKVDAPSPLPPIQADARRLNQVLVNLISNASKYGPPQAPIRLRVEERSADVLVEVSDRGPGLRPICSRTCSSPFPETRIRLAAASAWAYPSSAPSSSGTGAASGCAASQGRAQHSGSRCRFERDDKGEGL